MRNIVLLGVLISLPLFLCGLAERPMLGPDGLHVKVHTDKKVYAEKEPVHISIKITNLSSEAISKYFPSGQKFDIVVMSGSGEVWRWSKGRMFIMAIQPFLLDPGQSVAYEHIWMQDRSDGGFAGRGKYSVIGEIAFVPPAPSKEKVITIK